MQWLADLSHCRLRGELVLRMFVTPLSGFPFVPKVEEGNPHVSGSSSRSPSSAADFPRWPIWINVEARRENVEDISASAEEPPHGFLGALMLYRMRT